MKAGKTTVLILAASLHAASIAQAAASGAASALPEAAEDARSTQLWADELASEQADDLAGAIGVCMQILRHDPKDPRAMNTIAGLDGKLGRFRDEITWARRALAVDHGFFQAEINLGSAQAALGQAKAAQASFEQASKLAPNNPMPVYSLGVLAENRHDVPAATALYQRSVALDPKFESGWFNLAAMHATAGRFDDAIVDLDKVLALDPQARDAQAMRRHVEADKAAAAKR